ncbi:hypothetical protein [Aminipila sp.]|uniref:hypothetical protein n=1 Tax=Aminipila sp. TaxID=2060095 RepID=UPI0028A1A230|nr:hypothetical protein [Aminipila sp.]
MFFLFVTMLLGKFIWFDGVNIGLNKEDFKDFLSQKFLLFLIAFCLIFIAILCFAETYGYINVVSIFIGMDFGMALAGIIIVTKEIKGVKKHIDLNIETPIDN